MGAGQCELLPRKMRVTMRQVILETYCPYDESMPFAIAITPHGPDAFRGECLHAGLANHYLAEGGWTEVQRMMPALAHHIHVQLLPHYEWISSP